MTKKRASKYGQNRYYNVTFADLATVAATTGDVKLFDLPQGAIITDVLIKHSTKFAGGAISAVTAQVQTAQNNYGSAFDVFQNPGAEVFGSSITPFREKFSSTVPVNLHFVATGGNLSTLTQGVVDVIVNYRLAGVQ